MNVQTNKNLQLEKTWWIKNNTISSANEIVEYFGSVTHSTNERVIARIKEVRAADPTACIHLVVSSAGGPTGAGMAFYDHVRHILRQPLVTIGTGDIDSSGIVIFLTGEQRIISPRTTSLLHMVGRKFDPNARYTASEMEAMAREDALKDHHYASVVSERCGTLSTSDVLELMRKNTVLSPEELIDYGFAHALL